MRLNTEVPNRISQSQKLERDITCAKFAHMGADGDQAYEFTAYNLDIIISVGYRVKSKRGTKFRQWLCRAAHKSGHVEECARWQSR